MVVWDTYLWILMFLLVLLIGADHPPTADDGCRPAGCGKQSAGPPCLSPFSASLRRWESRRQDDKYLVLFTLRVRLPAPHAEREEYNTAAKCSFRNPRKLPRARSAGVRNFSRITSSFGRLPSNSGL